MATRSLNVVIAGDSKPLGVAAKQADRHMDSVSKGAGRMGNAVKAGFAVGAVGAGALVVGLKSTVDAAKDAEASMAKVKTIVNNAGISFRAHAKEIDRVIQAHSRLTGFDDEDLSESLANMVRTTGNLSEAFKLNALAADIARAKGVDLAGAQSLLARVYNGSFTGVKRLGIAIEPVTKAQDALKASTEKATAEQVRAAKAADKTATSQLAISKLQKAFGGQAEAYGKTAAGAQERFSVALENVQEKLGAGLLPVLAKVTNGVAQFLNEIEAGTGTGGRFADQATAAFERIKATITSVRSSVGGLVEGFRQGETGARSLATGLGAAVAGFVAFKVVSTVIAGVTALRAAWAGLTAAMATNPIGLIAVALGAVIGALAIMKVNTRSAADASRDLTDALRAQADALRAVRDIDVDVAQRKANLASANVAVEQAEKRLTALRKDGNATALDIKQAEADLKQARVSQERATRDVGDAEADSRRKREDANKATDEAREKTRSLIAAKKDELAKTDAQIQGLTDIAIKYGRTSDKVEGLRSKSQQLRQEIDKLESKEISVKVAFTVPGIGNALPSGDGMGSAIRGVVGKLANKAMGAGSLPRFGGGLKGARASMAPFAAIGQRFGLGVSSGRRPGAITSSGNVSYHSSGEALDISGSPSGMLGFFNYLKATVGGRLAELIYTPGGAGIKNGRSYTYGGQVAADHYDHVHVALDTGAPGVGDGLGRFDATSYGPPWGGIQGTGVTATGVNLKGSPHMYGVAVDPNVIPLGSKLKISPNPFGYTGAFTAFDTGGAIKGKRIDFYDWRGRAKQNGWGHKDVSVSIVSGSSGGSSKGKQAAPKRGSSVAKGNDGVPRAQPAPTTRLVTLSDGRRVRLPVDDSPFRPFDGKSIKGINPDAPPEPRETSTVGEVQSGGGGLNDLLAAAPTADDFAVSKVARARLTDTKDDDAAALTELLGIRKATMEKVLDDADPRNDEASISAYLEVRDALNGLTDVTKQLLDVQSTIADNGKRMATVAERSQGLQSQFIAWLSSAMGGSVALGMQAAGTPGVMARY